MAYNSMKTCNSLRNNGGKGIIPPRKNFYTLSKAPCLGGGTAKDIWNTGEEEWQRIHECGRRWRVGTYPRVLREIGKIIRMKMMDLMIHDVGLSLNVIYCNIRGEKIPWHMGSYATQLPFKSVGHYSMTCPC